MNLDRKKMNDLIAALNASNIQILEVYDPENREETMRLFKTGVFRPASNESHFHSLSLCTDITEIMSDQHSIYVNSPNFIQQVITAIDRVERRVSIDLSKDWRWIWYKL